MFRCTVAWRRTSTGGGLSLPIHWGGGGRVEEGVAVEKSRSVIREVHCEIEMIVTAKWPQNPLPRLPNHFLSISKAHAFIIVPKANVIHHTPSVDDDKQQLHKREEIEWRCAINPHFLFSSSLSSTLVARLDKQTPTSSSMLSTN